MEGRSSEGCMKWGGGDGGSLKDLFKNILKQGWVKGKVIRRGELVLKVSPPLLPPKISIIHILGNVSEEWRNIK